MMFWIQYILKLRFKIVVIEYLFSFFSVAFVGYHRRVYRQWFKCEKFEMFHHHGNKRQY